MGDGRWLEDRDVSRRLRSTGNAAPEYVWRVRLRLTADSARDALALDLKLRDAVMSIIREHGALQQDDEGVWGEGNVEPINDSARRDSSRAGFPRGPEWIGRD